MTRLIVGFLALLALCAPSSAQVFQALDVEWQNDFAGAVLWSTLGVNDDNFGTDNLAALNNLPGTNIIADCPHGGWVGYSGTWLRKSHQHIWYQNCPLKSSLTTLGVYPIIGPAINATAPLVDLRDYGKQFSFITPTNGVREYLLWCDHCKIKYDDLNGNGGYGFIRGSDREIGYVTQRNTIQAAGNPGIRDIGNVPVVAAAAGMHQNVYTHHFTSDAGDGRDQVCQPTPSTTLGSTITPAWLYNVSTNGVLYENTYSVGNNSGAVILINEQIVTLPGDTYNCDNVYFRNVSGGARLDVIGSPGGPNSGTHNVLISGGSYDGSAAENALAAIGIGQIRRGPFTFSGTNMGLFRIENRTVANQFLQAVEIAGPFPLIRLYNLNIGAGQKPVLRAAVASISGTTGLVWSGGSIVVNSSNALGGLSFGDNDQVTTDITVSGVTITGVEDGQSGILAQSVFGGSVNGNTITPAAGATTAVGLSLTTEPNGTHYLTALTNNLNAMPIRVICADGQGNNVAGCFPNQSSFLLLHNARSYLLLSDGVSRLCLFGKC